MVSLRALLAHLETKRTARIEIVSGRRPCLVLGEGREKADFKNLADEALYDDDVLAICESAGGKQLDALDERGTTWVYDFGDTPIRVKVEMRGRAIAATFRQASPGPEASAPRKPSQAARRKTQPELARAEVARPKSIPPQKRRTVPPPNRKVTPAPDRGARDARSRATDPGFRAPRSPDLSVRDDETTIPPRRDASARRDPAGERRDAAADRRDTVPQRREAAPERREAPAQVTPERREAAAEKREERRDLVEKREEKHDTGPRAQPDLAPPPSSRADEPEAQQPLARIQVEQVRAPNPRARKPSDRALASFAWSAEQSSASRLNDLLDEGRRTIASDLHLVALGGGSGEAPRPPLLRRAGSLVAATTPLPERERESAILALVPLAHRGALETKGAVDFALDVPRLGRFRVNVTLTLRGLKASLRFIPRELPTFESLELPEALRAATDQHQGLIIVSGPAGHGKTTTLAALVDHINTTRPHHVITVEDPIEIVHPVKSAILSQREVGTQTRSFARALKGALRQDPDVIVVGELRDTETVRMALSASETGHLVIATMNTPSAANTIDALIDFFPPGDQPQVRATLGGGLKFIVSQRLVPRADGKGCVAAAETLPGSLPLWNMIRDAKTYQLPSHMQRGKGAGIIRLNDSLADLVQRGVIELDEAMRNSTNTEELQTLIRGDKEPPSTPGREPSTSPSEKMVSNLLERAGAFFTRRGGGS